MCVAKIAAALICVIVCGARTEVSKIPVQEHAERRIVWNLENVQVSYNAVRIEDQIPCHQGIDLRLRPWRLSIYPRNRDSWRVTLARQNDSQAVSVSDSSIRCPKLLTPWSSVGGSPADHCAWSLARICYYYYNRSPVADASVNAPIINRLIRRLNLDRRDPSTLVSSCACSVG